MCSGLEYTMYMVESTPDIVLPNSGQYVLGEYVRKWYAGNVIEISAENRDVQVDFMRRSGPVAFGNRFLNNSWVVGLTQWIVYIHFFCILTYAIIYVLIHHIIFRLYLYFLNILYFSKHSCTNIFHRHSLYTFYKTSQCWDWWSQLQLASSGMDAAEATGSGHHVLCSK